MGTFDGIIGEAIVFCSLVDIIDETDIDSFSLKDFLSLRSNKEEVVCRSYPANSDIFAGFIRMIVTLFNPANSKLFAGLLGS